MELEDQNERLRKELVRARAETDEAVERTHRKYRRDLVPVNRAPVPYRGRR